VSESNLQQELDEFKKQFTAMVPLEAATVVFESIDELARSGLAQQSIQAGDKAPDFSLPNVRGEMVSLAKSLARGPVVLAFYRGVW
jgi:hypothetical protein